MELYKYVNDDRIDILINGLIRFSQPSVWNDPFELQPYYKDNKPKNHLHQLIMLSNLVKQIQDTNEVSKNEIEEYEQERKRITKDDIYSFIHRNIIGLSLTEDKDNLLMWSHYASNHSGFVIEFDADNNFFHNSDKYLFKITCDKQKPDVENNEFASLMIDLVDRINERKKIPEEYFSKISNSFRKSVEWEYEKEWRLITTSNKAVNYDEFKDDMNVFQAGNDSELNRGLICKDYIALLEIPISCIKAIYCGKRMKRSRIRQLFFLTKYNPYYSHIKLMRSEIDDKFYKLNYKEVKEYDILNIGEIMYEQSTGKEKLEYNLKPDIQNYENEKKEYKKIKPAGNKSYM